MANKNELPNIHSFYDRKGNLVNPDREDYNARKSANVGKAYAFFNSIVNVGKAYAFFNCEASKRDIEKELLLIRRDVKTPNALELSLMENPNERLMTIARAASEGDSFNHEYDLVTSAIKDGRDLDKHFSRFVRLVHMIDISKGSGARYVMEATYPNATNRQTAEEVASVLNQAYQSPLYQEEEEFRGEVVYEEQGRYIFRE